MLNAGPSIALRRLVPTRPVPAINRIHLLIAGKKKSVMNDIERFLKAFILYYNRNVQFR